MKFSVGFYLAESTQLLTRRSGEDRQASGRSDLWWSKKHYWAESRVEHCTVHTFPRLLENLWQCASWYPMEDKESIWNPCKNDHSDQAVIPSLWVQCHCDRGIQWIQHSQLEDLDLANDLAILSTKRSHLEKKTAFAMLHLVWMGALQLKNQYPTI